MQNCFILAFGIKKFRVLYHFSLICVQTIAILKMASIIFILLASAVFYFAFKAFYTVYQNINLGKPYEWKGQPNGRIKDVLLIALGQKKMFDRPLAAFMHLFIYVAFLMTQVELIEIFIDGIFGTHRFLAPYLGSFYSFIIGFIEVLSLLAFFATLVFLSRRNLLKLPRFTKAELLGWPSTDANLILLGEILLIFGIFTMNGADHLLQQIDPAHYPPVVLPVSSILGPLLFNGLDTSTLVFLERFGWWQHVIVVFGFILYLPYSKHLHIFLAFPNVYFRDPKSRGEMENMPAIMNEVKSMFGLPVLDNSESEELPVFGAGDVTDLSWKNLLDAYTCTECGRCTSVCPANITGKKLSPRKIMMDVRDRATELGSQIKKVAPATNAVDKKAAVSDDKNLFSYISREEIRACTSCNACVEACPVLINPLDIILQMRRYEVLTESQTAEAWTPMFTSLENQGCVWQVPQERDAWIHS